MGPIRDLISRIRERRMERMGSRQGLFPRLRNLINPLDSQSMMDRAQGTKVGTASPAPLSYSKRLFPSTAGGPATAAPKVAGKTAPPDAATQDLDSLTPPPIGDLEAQFKDAQSRARIARAQAKVPGQALEAQSRLIQEATYYERQAQQLNSLFTQKGIADSLQPKPALTGQFESQEDVERRLFSGQTTPAAGAQVVFNGKQAGRETPLVGPAAEAELQGLTRQLTMPYVAGQMSMGQMPTPGSPLGEQFKMALDTLPPEQRQPFVTASLGPALQKSFISRVQAAAVAAGAPPPAMGLLMQDASAHAQAELAKIDPSYYGDAQKGSMLNFFADVAKGGYQMLNQAVPAARDVSRGGSKLVENILARPTVNAAPPSSIPPPVPAAPVAPPVAQPLQMAPSRPPAQPVARPPRVAPTREEIIRKAQEDASPTYPNGQPKPWAVPQGRK